MKEKIWIALFKSFLRQLNKLSEDEPDVNIRDELENVGINLLENQTSSGLCLEEPVGAVDENMRIVDINDKFSAVLNVQNKIYFMLWVDDHDNARNWARNNILAYNFEIGGYQVFDVSESDDNVDSNQSALFGMCTPEQLLEIGVPREKLPTILSFPDETAFFESEYKLSGEGWECAFFNLELLIKGASFEEVLKGVKETKDALSEYTDDTPNNAPPSLITLTSFIFIEDKKVLGEIMNKPLEEWRLFLHAEQREAAGKDYPGPALVLGRAGTGKTVVAMHRAKFLASKCKDGQKVLVTTFTTNLANDINENLKKLCTQEEMEKIEVINLDAWVSKFLKVKSFSRTLTYPNDKNLENQITKCWKNAVEQAGDESSYGPSFYREEWEQVAANQEEITRDQYVNANRDRQRIALTHEEREKIWDVFEKYQEQMEINYLIDVQMAMRECIRMLKKDTLPKYEHIVVDEGQDFSNNAYRLIRTLAGDEHKNDIFIVGDSHQRIYENIPTLFKCGINIGKSITYLKINYRTTEEIQKVASALLDGIKFDDLNGGTDPEKIYTSSTRGQYPVIKKCADENKETDFLIEKLLSLQKEGVNSSDICITARNHDLVKKCKENLEKGLKEKGVQMENPFYEIKTGKTDDREIEGFRIATMHRLKGLEFQYVFIVSVNDKIFPLELSKKTDSISKEQTLDLERNLLYVAMTRAQWGVYLTGYGKKPSKFIKQANKIVEDLKRAEGRQNRRK